MIHKLDLQRIKNYKGLEYIFSKGSSNNTTWRRLCEHLIKASKQVYLCSSSPTTIPVLRKYANFFSLCKMRMEKSASAAGITFESKNKFKSPTGLQQLHRLSELEVMISPGMRCSCKNQPRCQYLQNRRIPTHLCGQITFLCHLYQVFLEMRHCVLYSVRLYFFKKFQ